MGRFLVAVSLIANSACTESASNSSGHNDPDPATDSADPLPATDAPDAVDETDQLCQLALDCPILPTYGVREPCSLRVTNQAGDIEWDGPVDAWIRGRSSSQVAKPGYGIELHDESGASVNADLLGMGGESDWVIDGLYYDRLLVRDKLGYDLFRSWNPDNYAAESALCELTRNGEYFGIHSLAERIKRDDDRVDIADGAESGDAFVMAQIDHECFYTNTTTYGWWKLVSPPDDRLTAEGADSLTRFLAGWEANVVAVNAGADPAVLWTQADMDSVVDTVIIEEFFKNEDSFYTSLHMWKDESDTLRFTPWDLDMTFGQFPYYPYGNYGAWDVWIGYRPELWSTFAGDPVFRAKLAARWAELRAGSLDEATFNAHLDQLEAILGDALQRNLDRWPITDINYGGWFYEVNSYEDEDAHVRQWAHDRLLWMDENIGNY